MFPRLVFDMIKVKDNLDAVAGLVKSGACSLMIVTKSICADRRVVELVASHPQVDYLADSRIKNIKSYKDLGKETVLLRLPQHDEIEDVVRYADLSFNSELSTIKLLDEEAERQGKVHKIVLMIDLGDLREGLFFQDRDNILRTVKEIKELKNIQIEGVGTNLTCYGAIIPKPDNLTQLTEIAGEIRKEFMLKLPIVSGGNSSSLYLIEKGGLPAGINNLRIGEAFILGNETAYGNRIQGSHPDAITLEAQIIELKEKPSLPIGEAGMDAFGRRPYYEDRGNIKRAILAIGRQDADIGSMFPTDPDIDILGASSDHLIMDVSRSKHQYKTGDTIAFTLGYGGLLKAATSGYVGRIYINSK